MARERPLCLITLTARREYSKTANKRKETPMAVQKKGSYLVEGGQRFHRNHESLK